MFTLNVLYGKLWNGFTRQTLSWTSTCQVFKHGHQIYMNLKFYQPKLNQLDPLASPLFLSFQTMAQNCLWQSRTFFLISPLHATPQSITKAGPLTSRRVPDPSYPPQASSISTWVNGATSYPVNSVPSIKESTFSTTGLIP